MYEVPVLQPTPFNDTELRNWMGNTLGLPGGFPRRVASLGSGPFEEHDFDTFLTRLGVEIWEPDPDFDVVVVGREGWSEEDLLKVIVGRVGLTVRIYSQEMLLAWILCRTDPFDGDENLLKRLAGDHPALEFLMDFGFDWPGTEVVGGGGSDVELEVPKVGILAHMGYRVGRTAGRSRRQRQRVLRNVFEAETLPFVMNREYMRQWGGANSSSRLSKIAHTIASLCRNEKRRNEKLRGSLNEAIAQREEDLNWMKEEFYDGRFDFFWPSTQL